MVVRDPSSVSFLHILFPPSPSRFQIHDGFFYGPRGFPAVICICQRWRPPPLQLAVQDERVHGHADQHGVVRLRFRSDRWTTRVTGFDGNQRRVYDLGDGVVRRIHHTDRVEVRVQE